MRFLGLLFGVILFTADGFTVLCRRCHVRSEAPATTLHAKNRGKLASYIDLDDAVLSKTKAKAKAKTNQSQTGRASRKRKGSSQQDTKEKISPLLAEWAAQPSTESTSEDTLGPPLSAPQNVKFESFKEVRKSRKNKKKPSIRQMAQAERDEKCALLVEQLLSVLDSESKTKDIDDILNPIKQLVALPSATEEFRTLTVGSKQRNNYRLAWVGGDDAISHVGTGLHKVPLARLQDVFLSLPGRNTVELLEVIRVLGPFPNVKNVLQGTSSMPRRRRVSNNDDDDDDSLEWSITWESMLDGTGKELLAGKQDNIRRVDLHVQFSTPKVIVATVPPKDMPEQVARGEEDLFEDSGKNVLVFVEENGMDVKLEKYRVA